MKWKLRFSVRTLLFLFFLSAIPCWWIACEVSEFQSQNAALVHMQKVNPSMRVTWKNKTPSWLSKIGIQPDWMNRITRLDATGVVCGQLRWKDYPKEQIEFDDKDFEQIFSDIEGLNDLREIYFQVTKLSDDSIELFSKLSNIEMLCLHETDVTNAGARELQQRMPSTEIAHYQAGSK